MVDPSADWGFFGLRWSVLTIQGIGLRKVVFVETQSTTATEAQSSTQAHAGKSHSKITAVGPE